MKKVFFDLIFLFALTCFGFSPEISKSAELVVTSESRNTSALPIWDIFSVKEEQKAELEHLFEVNSRATCQFKDTLFLLTPFDDLTYQTIDRRFLNERLGKKVIKTRLPYEDFYGFSNLSRRNYFEYSGVDPLDILSPTFFSQKEWDAFGQWRVKTAFNFVSKMLNKMKDLEPNEVIAVYGNIAWLKSTKNQRYNSIDDWPKIAKAGLMDEVILEGEWEKPENKKLLALAREELKGTKVKMSVALEARRDGKALDLLTQLLNLQGEAIHEIYVKVDDEADTTRAQTFVKETLPEFEFGLGEKPAETQTPQ